LLTKPPAVDSSQRTLLSMPHLEGQENIHQGWQFHQPVPPVAGIVICVQ
jgi:hypothetical protein